MLIANSYYSLRYGTLSIETLVELSKNLGWKAVCLADINTSQGVVDFVKECNDQGIKPVAGIEFRNETDRKMYLGIARNNEGFRQLNEFLTYHNLAGKEFPEVPDPLPGVVWLYPFINRRPGELGEHERAYVTPAEIRKLLTSPYRSDPSKLLYIHRVTFADKEGYFLHRNLRAVDNNILMSRLSEKDTAHSSERMAAPAPVRQLMEEHPEILYRTDRFFDECEIDFDFKTVKNKKTFTGNRYDDKILLEKLALDGLEYRYGKENREAYRRVQHELEIIDRLGFSPYFLITWDIIRYTMSRGFYHVGRGSGANSIVAYCLKITNVDPIELDLYFERFINPRRTSPPDFDIDFSWKERDEVLDYIFKRYGHLYTAFVGATSTFKDRSPIRELGKVYGLPKAEIDFLSDFPERASEKDALSQKIVKIADMLTDFPNVRSIHAGGVLVSEEPLTAYVALFLPPKGFPTTHWDMYTAEAIGFEKLDILSQRGIGHIRDCASIVRQNQGVDIDVHDVKRFKTDPKVKNMLRVAETNGCFYIESPAMRGLLRKLSCDNYITLVAASSIIRPGVARSGMMKEYIKRFHNPKDFTYLHPVMEEQLKETFGVMVYQEDVLKVCHHYAGLDLAEADVLRRAMSGKVRGKKEFQMIVERFFEKSKNLGRPDDITREVWRQVESFAGYAFSKAHSASFAVESFQSLFLKAYYPLEFMVAVINNFGGYFRTWVYFNEARRWGARIHLPCVNNGQYLTSIKGKNIYMGFVHVAGLEYNVAKALLDERDANGLYAHLVDFISRTGTGLQQLIILIRTGALRFTGKSKAELLWEAHLYFGKDKSQPAAVSLFDLPVKQYQLPQLVHNPIEDAYDEIEFLGFPVTMTYFDLLQTSFRGETRAHSLMNFVGRKVRMVGQLVVVKYVKTVKNELMHFGTFLDADGEFFDTVNFPSSLKLYPFKGYGAYLILGTVTEEFGFATITVEKMAKLPIRPDPRQ